VVCPLTTGFLFIYLEVRNQFHAAKNCVNKFAKLLQIAVH